MRNSSTLKASLIVFCTLLSFFAWSTARSTGVQVRVGLYDNSPKIAMGEQGKPEGVFVDVIEEVAKREGWRLQYVPGSWKEGLERLESGEIDLMPDVAFSTERAERFDFNQEEVLSSWFQVYAKADEKIRSVMDLSGKTVLVLQGSIQEDVFSSLAHSFKTEVKIETVADYATMFSLLQRGQADAGVTNPFYGYRHAKSYGLQDTAVVFHPFGLFFATAKGSHSYLLEAIDRQLIDMKAKPDSLYHQSIQRWLTQSKELPDWILKVLILGVLMTLLVAGHSALLSRKVATKTAELRERNRESEWVNQIVRAVSASIELRVVLAEATHGVMRLSELDSGVLSLVDTGLNNVLKGQSLFLLGPEQFTGAEKNDENAQSCSLYLAQKFGTTQPVLIPGGESEAASSCGRLYNPQAQWNIFFTLSTSSRTLGLLCLHSFESDPPEERVLNRIQQICLPLALAIENASLYENARNLAIELEFRVNKRTEELQVALEAAKSADRAKSTFLTTMSHEIRTPLNAIIGFTGMLYQGLSGPINEEQKKQLGIVRESSKHLRALINDVLDLSKIEAGRMDVQLGPVPIFDCLEKAVALCRPLAQNKGLNLLYDQQEKTYQVMGEAVRIEQIVINLLGNAVKFTEAGQIRLAIREINAEEFARGARFIINPGSITGEGISISVKDTGVGIRATEFDRIFLPFAQIDTSVKPIEGGTGLGLAICARLVALMNGAISVESTPGIGSEFQLWLPVYHRPEN